MEFTGLRKPELEIGSWRKDLRILRNLLGLGTPPPLFSVCCANKGLKIALFVCSANKGVGEIGFLGKLLVLDTPPSPIFCKYRFQRYFKSNDLQEWKTKVVMGAFFVRVEDKGLKGSGEWLGTGEHPRSLPLSLAARPLSITMSPQ